MVAIGHCTCLVQLKESNMKRSLTGRKSAATPAGEGRNQNVRSAAGYELSAAEAAAVHGGELKLEMPAYVPLSQSHPKTEVTLPRVPYK